MKIIIEKQDSIELYESEVDRILNELGHPEALVTDESRLSDFFYAGRETDEERAVLQKLSEGAARPVTVSCRLWEIARDMNLRKSIH